MQESQIIVQINALFCCWFLFALISPNLFPHFLKLIYIYILKIENEKLELYRKMSSKAKEFNIIYLCVLFWKYFY